MDRVIAHDDAASRVAHRCRAWAVATVATLVCALPAHAQSTSGSDVAVSVTASGCVDAPELRRRLHALSRRIRFVDGGAKLTFRVIEDAEGAHGDVQFVAGDGSVSRRSLRGAKCADTSAALALVAALWLDPELELGSDSEPRSAAIAPPPGPTSKWELRAGAYGILSSFAPAVLLGGGALLDARVQRAAPSFRLALGYEQTLSALEVTPGQAHVELWLGRGAACPLRIGSSPALLPCLSVASGLIRASGSRVSDGTTDEGLWLEAGPALRGELVSARGGAAVELELGLRFPIVRHRLSFQGAGTEPSEIVPVLFSGAVAGHFHVF